MPSWESIEKTYSDAITSAFPLHRLMLFFSGVVFSLAIKNQDYLSISETISKIKISEFASLSSDLFAVTDLGDIVFGFSLVAMSWILSKLLTKMFFLMAVRLTNIWRRIDENSNQFDFESNIELSKRKEFVEWIDSILVAPQKKISSINSFSELFLGLSLALIVSSYWGNLLDVLYCFIFLFFSLLLKFKAINLFISDVLGASALKNQIQGISPQSRNKPD